MNTADVLILARDAAEYLPLLKQLGESGCSLTSAGNLAEATKGEANYEVILGQPDLTAEFLGAGHEVAWVQSTWAGVTPLLDLGRHDFMLTGVKDTFGTQISEYVFSYLLAQELKLLERLGHQANRHWWPEPSGTLAGKTLGVMGCGSIGRHVALTGRQLGMKTVGFSRLGHDVDGFDKNYPAEGLKQFLAEPDYLVCALPETTETKRLLDERAFAAMKPGAYLVNVGRGSLIEEQPLLSALAKGRLAGAALDVFCTEPLPEKSALWHAENVLVTAHIAAISRPADIAEIFLANFEHYRRGKTLNYRIDFERGY